MIRAGVTLLFLASLSLCVASRAQDRSAPAEAKIDPNLVAATVNGDPVYVSEVEGVLRNLRKLRQSFPKGTDDAKADILKHLIRRRLVEQMLLRDESFVKESEIEQRMSKLRATAQTKKMTLEQFLEKGGATVTQLRHDLIYEIGWPKYLDGHLAEGLEDYFNAHRKLLDGTTLRASHILLRPEKFNETPAQTIERAAKIREEINGGKITFEKAAEKYSAGPSREQGGDIGFFPRQGVMTEEFSKAAFGLEKNQISQPVVTGFGVHLIKITDEKPGNRQWTEVIPQIQRAAASDMVEKVAAEEMPDAKIEFTGNSPYYDPEDGKLVMPQTTAAK